jgi:uncharacterized protein
LTKLVRGLLVLLLSICGLAFAQAQQVVAVPPLSGRVVDLTNTLSAAQKSELSTQLEALEKQKGSQLVVLMVPSTQPETVAEYGLRVAEAWKIGRAKAADPSAKGKVVKVDDGVLLLIAKDDRKIRIEVGYGLEGAIPDALAKRIITDSIAPKFRTGDFFGGVRAGVGDLIKLIQGEALPAPAEVWQHGQAPSSGAGNESDSIGWFAPLIFVFVLGFVLKAILGRFLGSTAAGGAAWFVSSMFGAPALVAIIAAIVMFLVLLLFGGAGRGLVPQGRRSYRSGGPILPGGFGGGGWGGGGSGGGFGGGGGSFGGGGASGDW